MWGCSDKRLKLAQILGQLGVFLTEADAPHAFLRAGPRPRLQGKNVFRRGSHTISAAPHLGLDRIVALYHRSSASYQIHYHIRCLYF
jgi:hypothetical protein